MIPKYSIQIDAEEKKPHRYARQFFTEVLTRIKAAETVNDYNLKINDIPADRKEAVFTLKKRKK